MFGLISFVRWLRNRSAGCWLFFIGIAVMIFSLLFIMVGGKVGPIDGEGILLFGFWAFFIGLVWMIVAPIVRFIRRRLGRSHSVGDRGGVSPSSDDAVNNDAHSADDDADR